MKKANIICLHELKGGDALKALKPFPVRTSVYGLGSVLRGGMCVHLTCFKLVIQAWIPLLEKHPGHTQD